LDSEGNVVEFKFRGIYFFVHDKELRECYDTWQVIERLKKIGFQENPAFNNTQEIINYYLPKKSKKKGVVR